MKNGSVNLVDLDFEYKIWKNRLEMFKKEMGIVKDRNVEVVDEGTIKELNTVELMVLDEHTEELNVLLNRIKTQEDELQYFIKDFPIVSTHKYYKDHEALRLKMESMSSNHLERVDDLIKALGI